MYALATSPGPRLAGAFLRNVKALPWEPAVDGTNTSSTVTLKAKALDPFRRNGYVQFQLDRTASFSGAKLQSSPSVSAVGWPDTPTQWTSTAIENTRWYYRARAFGMVIGAGPGVTGRWATATRFTQSGGAGFPRALYVFVNKSIALDTVGARALYLAVNRAIQYDALSARALYLAVNRAYTNRVLRRALYTFVATRDGEVFPWLTKLDPTEQYVGGQVSLFGDGFGQYLEAGAPLTTTITVDSVNGGNLAENVRDRTANRWASNSTRANAWIRFTFPAPKRIVGVALETGGNGWGVPRFLFSGTPEINGVVAVPATDGVTEYPVGGTRVYYQFPAAQVTSYVEIRGSGSTTLASLSEVWILEEIDPAQDAETSRALLNRALPAEQAMGIVSWSNRSPNLYPANSGVPLGAAAVVTVPANAVSGLVFVEEST